MTKRADGLTPGAPFFVVLMFDHDGYYSSVLAHSEAEVVARASARLAKLKSIVACSTPFQGKWQGLTPDITPPPEYGLEALDRSPGD